MFDFVVSVILVELVLLGCWWWCVWWYLGLVFFLVCCVWFWCDLVVVGLYCVFVWFVVWVGCLGVLVLDGCMCLVGVVLVVIGGFVGIW